MPPKRTPNKEKTPKGGKSRLIAPVIRSRESSVDSNPGTAGTVNPVFPVPAGISPDFLAFMQMQERARAEERKERAEEKIEAARLRAEEKEEAAQLRAILESQRKDDLERAEIERFAMNKAHETQIKMLQDQLAAMSGVSGSSGPKSSSKMPMFDLVKDKETFPLWKSRWLLHIQGHNFDKISDPVERNVKLRSELNSCLSDSTLSWLLNNNFSDEDIARTNFVLDAIELKINESANPLIQQIELSRIVQHEHETGDHLCQRIREMSSKCAFDKITNVQDHYNMLTLLRAVKPQIRKKMLLQKVDTFDKAIEVLLSEEQANSDTKQCSEPKDAAVFATSAYKRDQKAERQSFQERPGTKPHPNYECPRCTKIGLHRQLDCPSLNVKCRICHQSGHYAKVCKNWNKAAPSGHANAIRAYLDTKSVNEQIIFNAQQIEKAESCGLVYNVEANDVENPEKMDRHQKFAMFGHLK